MNSIVFDVNDKEYRVESLLGEGGQGAVYRLKDESLAVKLLMKNGEPVEDLKEYKNFSDKINDIVIMRFDNDIHLCRPVIMLKEPMCGYIMKLLNNLKPVSELILPVGTNESLQDFFAKTGGLKKRYEVLIELARTIARLHSKGLVYCDLSPNNAFYAEGEEFSKVWLIDCDNLKFTNESKKAIFTPFYGAPEVENNVSSNTVFSDCFSFAVLAYRILLNQHPFEDFSNDVDSSDDWTNSTVVESKSKNYKWVYENNKNLLEYFNHFMSPKVFKLFKQTFSHEGIYNPISRPSMQEWYEALKDMYLNFSQCSCGQYYMGGESTCPFCNSPVKVTKVGSILLSIPHYKEIAEEVIDKFKDEYGDDFALTEEDIEKIRKKSMITKKDFPIYKNLKIYDFSINQITINKFPSLLFEIQYDGIDYYLFNNTDEEVIIRNDSELQKIDPTGRRLITNSKNIVIIYTDKESKIKYYLILRRYE